MSTFSKDIHKAFPFIPEINFVQHPVQGIAQLAGVASALVPGPIGAELGAAASLVSSAVVTKVPALPESVSSAATPATITTVTTLPTLSALEEKLLTSLVKITLAAAQTGIENIALKAGATAPVAAEIAAEVLKVAILPLITVVETAADKAEPGLAEVIDASVKAGEGEA